MGALFDRQHAVGERLLHRERRRLDAGLLCEGGVVDLDGIPVALGPSQVHPQEHGGEVRSIHAAGLGTNGDQSVALIVFTGKKGADLEGLDIGRQRLQVLLRLDEGAGIVLLDSELDQDAEVVDTTTEGDDAVHLRLQAGEPRRHQLGVVLVIPQVRGGYGLLQLCDLGAFPSGVEDSLDGGQCPVEHSQLGLEISGSHNGTLYATGTGGPGARDG